MSERAGTSDRGIVVLGTPRSGTTLLRRLLDAHPDITCPGETSMLSACARFLREDTIAEGVKIGVLAGLGHAGFSRATVLERLRDFAFSFHRELAVREGARRWAEKTAFDAFYAEQIVELCGDAVQYVFVIRNGLDVVCSLEDLTAKNRGYLPELHEYVVRTPDHHAAFAHCWADLTTRLLDLAERLGDRGHLLRYEDLVADPEASLGRLFGFLGESVPADLVERALSGGSNLGLGDWKTYGKRAIEASSVGRADALSPHARASIGKLINPVLRRAGYEVVEELEAEDDDATRRRYELGLMAQRLAGEAASSVDPPEDAGA